MRKRGGDKKKQKRAVVAESPPEAKTPHGLRKADSLFSEKPTWRTHRVDMSGPFSWASASASTILREVVPKLHNFESMTYREMKDAGNHDIEVVELCPEAQTRLGELGFSDLDSLYSMRLTGERRVWAHRDVTRLHILWWDPHHAVCPVQKKHT